MNYLEPNRRAILKSGGGVAALVATSILAPSHVVSKPGAPELMTPTLPPALKPGMKIGVPAPAGGVSKDDFEIKFKSFAIAMKSIGLEVVVAKSVLAGANGGASFLAAPDAVRASEFMEFVKRPDIHGIVCMRGGYGVMRILPMLDFEAIKQNPKVICGYSDITALINAVYLKSNLMAFHGPIAAAELDDFTRTSLLKCVYRDGNTNAPPAKLELRDIGATVAPGKASGRLVGGNLTLIASLMGTPYELNTRGAVLFLEDVGEKAYRIDRMLTQLWLAGKLQSCSAIVLGQFTEADEVSGTTSVQDVLVSRLSSLGIPVLGNFPVGHVKEKWTMPIGALVEVDASNKSFQILESVVLG